MSEEIQEVIEALTEISEDNTVPKNVKAKVLEVIKVLKEDQDMSMKIHKALSDLEEISDDANLQPFTRTQIWNVVSTLESI